MMRVVQQTPLLFRMKGNERRKKSTGRMQYGETLFISSFLWIPFQKTFIKTYKNVDYMVICGKAQAHNDYIKPLNQAANCFYHKCIFILFS